MSNWKKHLLKEQQELLQLTADVEGINQVAIEKDWWVTVTLKALFQSSCSESLLFKGGTSLSKGWNLIERFSEDIDLAIGHTFFGITEINPSQRKKLRKKSRIFIHDTLAKELDEKLKAMGISGYTLENATTVETAEGVKSIDSDKDPTVILLNYTSVIEDKIDYIPPRVKIEISCLSMDEPCEVKDITSLISRHYPTEDDETASAVKTVLPSRTFLEKAFLLNEEFQKKNPRHLRMSRHLYDLDKLMDTEFGKEALKDPELYEEIVKHRYNYYNASGIDYSLHHPSNICFYPSKELRANWEKDYNEMKQSFIYGETKDFDKLLERMEELKKRFQEVKTKDNLLE